MMVMAKVIRQVGAGLERLDIEPLQEGVTTKGEHKPYVSGIQPEASPSRLYIALQFLEAHEIF